MRSRPLIREKFIVVQVREHRAVAHGALQRPALDCGALFLRERLGRVYAVVSYRHSERSWAVLLQFGLQEDQ